MTADEGDIRFDFSQAVSWKRFDDNNHGLSHCMKAVDFVVDLSDRIHFIEVKDPENPSAENAESFKENFNNENYIKDVLVQKCRDSFLYEYGYSNVSKPVHYSVVVGLNTFGTSIACDNGNIETPYPDFRSEETALAEKIHRKLHGILSGNME